MKKLFIFIMLLFLSANAQDILIQVIKEDENGQEAKYDYVYKNNQKKNIQVKGKYAVITSDKRYVYYPSKSRRPSAAAAKVNANNYINQN